MGQPIFASKSRFILPTVCISSSCLSIYLSFAMSVCLRSRSRPLHSLPPQVASKLSIDTTYGDLGSLYDTADESLGDFHHVRASPETRRKQVAREAQLVKKMKQKDKRGSIASAVSQDDPESFSRRNSEKRKSQR